MIENYMVCNCKHVSYGTILDALHELEKFDDVLAAFESVKDMTHSSTGCGGCHDKVLKIISEELSGR